MKSLKDLSYNVTKRWDISCPHCQKQYQLPEDFQLPRKLRCAECSNVWMVDENEKRDSHKPESTSFLAFNQKVSVGVKTIPVTSWSLHDHRARKPSDDTPSNRIDFKSPQAHPLTHKSDTNPFISEQHDQKGHGKKIALWITGILLTLLCATALFFFISNPQNGKYIHTILKILSLAEDKFMIKDLKAQNIHHKDHQELVLSGAIYNPTSWEKNVPHLIAHVWDPAMKKKIDAFDLKLASASFKPHGQLVFEGKKSYPIETVVGPVRIEIGPS